MLQGFVTRARFSRAAGYEKTSRLQPLLAENLISGALCNKGTALAGPKGAKKDWALAPADPGFFCKLNFLTR
jgi:hypothetical protein